MSDRRVGLAGLLLLVPWALLVQRYWFVCDDAYITFRYSRNWAQGLGPIYNEGEVPPVEGYSDFLWMAIAAVVHRLGGDMLRVMPALSAVTGALALLLVLRVLVKESQVPALTALATTAVLATLPPFAVWSTSGLETMPQGLLHLSTWYLLAVHRDDRRAPWLAALCGLGLALIRTEGMAWVLVTAVIAGLHRRAGGRPVARALGPFLAVTVLGFGAYWVWRWSFYESLVANTAYAKVHLTPATFVRGLQYIGLFFATLVSPLVLLAVAASGLKGSRRVLVASSGTLGVGVLAYGVVVSGDYMTWFRILVPALPFLVIAFGAALADLRRQGLAVGIALATAVLGLLPAFDAHLVPQPVRVALTVRDKLDIFRTENAQWEAMNHHVEQWTERGLALKEHALPGEKIIAGAIGCLGFYSDLFILDRNGLVTAEVARAPWNGVLRSPGHDKTVEPNFFIAWKPELYDAKVIEGPQLAAKIGSALVEMGLPSVRGSYYPVLAQLPQERRIRRALLMLRRGKDADDVAAGRERFEAALAELTRKGTEEEP